MQACVGKKSYVLLHYCPLLHRFFAIFSCRFFRDLFKVQGDIYYFADDGFDGNAVAKKSTRSSSLYKMFRFVIYIVVLHLSKGEHISYAHARGVFSLCEAGTT